MNSDVARQRHFHSFCLSTGRHMGSFSVGDYPGLSMEPRPGQALVETDGPIDELHRFDVASGRLIDESDPVFAAKLESQWQRAVRLHPMLADAVPPVPLERVDGTFHGSSADIWDEFSQRAQAREWKPRAPAKSLDGLEGPFRCTGDCLSPVFEQGQFSWYDPSIPAQDDDIVLVRWDPRTLERIYKRNSGAPDWFAKYAEPMPLATKLLKNWAGEYWLVTNSGMFPLASNTILGVLRRSERDGTPLYDAPPVSHLGDNAATELFSSQNSGPVSVSHNPAVTTDPTLIESLSVTPTADGKWMITVYFEALITAGSTTSQSVIVGARAPALYGGVSFTHSMNITSTKATYTGVAILNAVKGVAFELGIFKWASVAASTFSVSNISLRVELIKR